MRIKHTFISESDSVVDNLNHRIDGKVTRLMKYFKNQGVKVKISNKIDEEEDSWHSSDEEHIDEALNFCESKEKLTEMHRFIENQK